MLHQAKDYSKDLHFNIPLDWIVHHTPSGYLDIYGWLKSMTQLSNLCNASPVKNWIIFFNGNDRHFDDRAFIHMEHQNIEPFILKAGDSVKEHPDDNDPNAKLDSI